MVHDANCSSSPVSQLVKELTPEFVSNLENAGVSKSKAEAAGKSAGEKVSARLNALIKEATSAEKSREKLLDVSPSVRVQIAGNAKAALFDRMYVLALATWVQAAVEALDSDGCKGDHSETALKCAPLPAQYAPDGARLRESPPMKVWNNMVNNLEDMYESAKDTVGDWLIAAGEWLKE